MFIPVFTMIPSISLSSKVHRLPWRKEVKGQHTYPSLLVEEYMYYLPKLKQH